MDTVRTDEVEALLGEPAERFASIDPDLRRTVLPPRRTVELALSDLGGRYHTSPPPTRPAASGSRPR